MNNFIVYINMHLEYKSFFTLSKELCLRMIWWIAIKKYKVINDTLFPLQK